MCLYSDIEHHATTQLCHLVCLFTTQPHKQTLLHLSYLNSLIIYLRGTVEQRATSSVSDIPYQWTVGGTTTFTFLTMALGSNHNGAGCSNDVIPHSVTAASCTCLEQMAIRWMREIMPQSKYNVFLADVSNS
jgi:hypothetical protein